jgi:hypothetical protein
MHQDKGNQQGKYLVYELDWKASLHDASVPGLVAACIQISTGKEIALSALIFSEGVKVAAGFAACPGSCLTGGTRSCGCACCVAGTPPVSVAG